MVRNIPRPHAAFVYFSRSNVIDVLNQSRQSDLKLEKYWVTQDGYFRLATTLFGITVTDAWRAYQWHLANNHRHKDQPILEFANILAFDCFENQFSKEPEVLDTFSIMWKSSPQPSTISALTQDSFNADVVTVDVVAASKPTCTLHKFTGKTVNVYKNAKDKERIGQRTKRGKCTICSMKTYWYCGVCKKPAGCTKTWVCHPTTERKCLVVHCDGEEGSNDDRRAK